MLSSTLAAARASIHRYKTGLLRNQQAIGRAQVDSERMGVAVAQVAAVVS